MALLVAFFAINYGQFFGAHREAQTAIDAAALEAARLVGRITVADPEYGRVALVDDTPDNNPAARPVWGLNTLLATARLDLIIANELGNTSMAYLARRDIENTQRAGRNLADTILVAFGQSPRYGGTPTVPAEDKNGQAIGGDLKQQVINKYKANSRRLGKGDLVEGSLRFEVGELTGGAGETNVPVPQPDSDERTPAACKVRNANGVTVYKPFVPVGTQVGSEKISFTFAAVADAPLLVDTGKFASLGGTTNFPSVVRVEADETVTTVAPKTGMGDKGGEHATHTVHVVACAQAGGTRVTHPSGALVIDFPDGLPPSNAAQSPNGGNINFDTIRQIMNASQIPANATASTPSPVKGWSSGGRWYKAVGGPVVDPNRTDVQPGIGVPSAFHGRATDDASVALSFVVYDWLKSCGLRPNVDMVVQALSGSLRQPLAYGQRRIYTPHGFFMDAPAFAQSDNGGGVASAMMDMVTDQNELLKTSANPDPRSWSHFAENPARYYQQTLTYNGWVNGATVIAEYTDPSTARITYYPDTGRTNGTPVTNFKLAVIKTNEFGVNTKRNAETVENEAQNDLNTLNGEINKAKDDRNAASAQKASKEQQLANELAKSEPDPTTVSQLQTDIANLTNTIAQADAEIATKEGQKAAIQARLDRAKACKANANYVMDTSAAMLANFKALTPSAEEDPQKELQEKVAFSSTSPQSPCHYVCLGDLKFFGVTQVPTVEAIKGTGACPTGQLPECSGSKDWCAPLQDGKSTIYLFKSQEPVQIGRRPSRDSFILPALAQASTTPVARRFVVAIEGDATRPETNHKVYFMRIPDNPFKNMATPLEGQMQFNAPNVLTTKTAESDANIIWSCMATDQYANGDGAYAADPSTPGYAVGPSDWCHNDEFGLKMGGDACQAEAAMWQLNSPMVKCPPGLQANAVERSDGSVVATQCQPPPGEGH
jgi:hypothetical protein